jgi:hypothetical protein
LSNGARNRGGKIGAAKSGRQNRGGKIGAAKSDCAPGTVFGDLMEKFDKVRLDPLAILRISWLNALTGGRPRKR